MKKAVMAGAGMVVLLLAGGLLADREDAEGCKDHPLFTRMPDTWIHSCSSKGFDSHTFPVAQGRTTQVEGQVWTLRYYPDADLDPKPGVRQIIRYYESAVKKLGGIVAYVDEGRETLRLTRDGREVWVDLQADLAGKYVLTIVQMDAMAQSVTGSADAFANDIDATGHAAVYGILFDAGRSDIKPESAGVLGEIAKLLAADPALKLYVVGHTDNEGTLEGNMKLSMERAQAVVAALTGAHGVAQARLKAFGNGPYAPVASNGTPEGRARNRRVELVER